MKEHKNTTLHVHLTKLYTADVGPSSCIVSSHALFLHFLGPSVLGMKFCGNFSLSLCSFLGVVHTQNVPFLLPVLHVFVQVPYLYVTHQLNLKRLSGFNLHFGSN